jgi:hypothetical protein
LAHGQAGEAHQEIESLGRREVDAGQIGLRLEETAVVPDQRERGAVREGEPEDAGVRPVQDAEAVQTLVDG